MIKIPRAEFHAEHKNLVRTLLKPTKKKLLNEAIGQTKEAREKLQDGKDIMPAKSAAQFGLMEAAVHGNAKKGPPASVAQDFLDKTPSSAKSKFAKALVKKRKAPPKVVDTDNDSY